MSKSRILDYQNIPTAALDEAVASWLSGQSIQWQKLAGLIPAIIQDIQTRQVLMQGFMNEQALHASLSSGRVTFFSRSRKTLWCKGESSGNFLHIRQLALDCDCDSLLILASPTGPTCHKGTNSCFSDLFQPQPNEVVISKVDKAEEFGCSETAELQRLGRSLSLGAGWLGALERIIAERSKPAADKTSAQSYVRRLFEEGIPRMAQKVGEEGVEVALAAVLLDRSKAQAERKTEGQTNGAAKGPADLAAEAADLLFHLLTLLQASGLSLQDAITVLEQRHIAALQKRAELDSQKSQES